MMNSIKFDLHTHNERCGHAIGTIEDYVNRLLNMGCTILEFLIILRIFTVKKTISIQGLQWQKVNLSLILRKYLRLKEKYKDKIHVLIRNGKRLFS